MPAAGLLGALLILLADAVLRAVQGADGAASIPTGVPTALLGAVVIVVLALRLRDTGPLRQPPAAGSPPAPAAASSCRAPARCVLLAGAVLVAVLAGSLWLRTGDLALWLSGTAPDLIGQALDDRVPRVLAAVLAGAALGLAGCVVQGTVRNPLAEPGVLGITGGRRAGRGGRRHLGPVRRTPGAHPGRGRGGARHVRGDRPAGLARRLRCRTGSS